MKNSENNNLATQVFSIWSDKVEKRLDPRFYLPYFTEFEQKISNRKDVKTLGEIANYIGSGATPLAGGDAYISKEEGGIPFIRVTNLEDGHIDLSDVLYIKPEIHSGILKRTQLKEGDLLLSMAGTIGLVAIVQDGIGEANINQALARIVLKDGYDNNYIATVLNSKIGKIQTNRLSRPSVQANINLDEIRSVKLPIPSIKIQKEVVETIRVAYAEKRKKETEIQKIIASIDGFVLGELGIEIPEGGVRRVFEVWSDEVTNRLDPIYLRDYSIYSHLESKYSLSTLEEVLSEPPQYGANERAVDGNPLRDMRYIRITDIEDDGELRADSWKTAEKIEDRYILQQDDLLFARSGATAGKTYIYKDEVGKAIFAGYMIRFKINSQKAIPDYVFCLTQTRYYELWKNLIQRPAGQPNINSEEFKSFKFPLPPMPVQEKIVDGVRSSYSKMRTLRIQATEVLANAQKRVERMILA
ncbi:MAG: restriction endonuclease subunit S [Candidatus Sungbacteria bacterium]|uniref:Restriction endonuclease subunit S n=1 Tax=Candidatus Sungiibacteriota bacterium TaxID=2750080 RepID=A0A9D6LUB3_9BACT|nr:restriction endonuclease subunit S [Candidatus Sungbacteria bacterium]